MTTTVTSEDIVFGIPDWLRALIEPAIKESIKETAELINVAEVDLRFSNKRDSAEIRATFTSKDLGDTEDETIDSNGAVISIVRHRQVTINTRSFNLNSDFIRIPTPLLQVISCDSVLAQWVHVTYAADDFVYIECGIIPHDRIDSILNVSKWRLIDAK